MLRSILIAPVLCPDAIADIILYNSCDVRSTAVFKQLVAIISASNKISLFHCDRIKNSPKDISINLISKESDSKNQGRKPR
jgi:hypothetical protein